MVNPRTLALAVARSKPFAALRPGTAEAEAGSVPPERKHPMLPKRLQERPLPEEFARKLLAHSTNAKSGSLATGELHEVYSPYFSARLGMLVSAPSKTWRRHSNLPATPKSSGRNARLLRVLA